MSAEEIKFNVEPLALDAGFEFLQEFAGPLSMVMPDAYNNVFMMLTQEKPVSYTVVKIDTGESIRAFYFKLDDDTRSFDLDIESNHFQGTLSADAMSIVATLYMLNTMLWSNQMPERVARYAHNAFYMLRDYAAQHPEAAAIYGAID